MQESVPRVPGGPWAKKGSPKGGTQGGFWARRRSAKLAQDAKKAEK